MSERQDNGALYAAMAQVFDELTYLRKTGKAGDQKAAVSADDVKRAVHRAYQRAGLVLLPTEVERTIIPHLTGDESKAVRKGYMVSVVIDFRTVHVKTGQEVTQRASGEGYDSTDSGGVKAYSRAIKNWAIATSLIETGFEAEKDDDDQPIDQDSIEQSFKRIKQELYSVAPSRKEADEKFATIIGYYQTHSKRPVEDPREFQTRAHALQAFAALRQALDIWSADRFEREAKEAPNPKANGRGKRDQLEITDDDLPEILRPMTEAEMDAKSAAEERV